MAEPLIVRLPDGRHGYTDWRVGTDRLIEPEALVGCVARMLPVNAALEYRDGPNGPEMFTGDPTPIAAKLVSAVLRILAQTTPPAWEGANLLELAQDIEAIDG